MCEPTTLAIMAAASTVAGLAGQAAAAKAQGNSNQRTYENALTARAENANQVNLERGQMADAAGQKINANNLSMREAQATAVAAAGPSGLSVDALLANLATKGGNYNESVTANLDRTNMALDNQLTNVNRSAASEINSLKTPVTPDYLGAGLKIGSAYMDYKKG